MIMRNREGPKKLKALKSDGFIHIPMSFTFELTVTDAQMDHLADRIVYEGIGDWGTIHSATHKQRFKRIPLPRGKNNLIVHYRFPIKVFDLDTGVVHIIRKENIYWALAITLIDFPYALDTKAGYNIDVDRLTLADIDEIIQVAATGKVFYIPDE